MFLWEHISLASEVWLFPLLILLCLKVYSIDLRAVHVVELNQFLSSFSIFHYQGGIKSPVYVVTGVQNDRGFALA